MTQSSLITKAEGKKVAFKITVPKFDNSNLIKGYGKTLIGRCMNPKEQDMKALLYMIPRIWQVEDRVAGADLGLGRFQFDFDNEEDIVEVLKMEPYHFDYWMLALVCWEPVVDINYPSKITFWVRILGVPLHYWADPTFRTIGEALGEIKQVDLEEGRVQVVLDGFKPLIFSSLIEFHNGEEITISLRYEKLFGFCRTCHSLCHDQSRCPTKRITSGDGRDDGPPANPGQGPQAASYKAVTTKSMDKNSGSGSSGDHNQDSDTIGRGDHKGKGLSRIPNNERSEGDFRAYKPRHYWRNGEGSSRGQRHSGYGPPNDSRRRYEMSSKGLNKLHNSSEGSHLSEHELKMVEAFKGIETSGSKDIPKARKELRFENEKSDLEEATLERNGETAVKSVGMKSQPQEEVLNGDVQMMEVTTEVTKEKHHETDVSRLDLLAEEDGFTVMALATDHREPSNEESGGMFETDIMVQINEEGLSVGDETLEFFDSEQTEKEAMEKISHGPRKKLSKTNMGGFGGTKKRLVQALISPRKKMMAKQSGKSGEGPRAGGEKGTSNPKKGFEQRTGIL